MVATAYDSLDKYTPLCDHHKIALTELTSLAELESVLRRKATSVVQKMEKQLQEAYTDMLLTKVKSKRIQAEHKVEGDFLTAALNLEKSSTWNVS